MISLHPFTFVIVIAVNDELQIHFKLNIKYIATY